jgi:hypothetical protein
MIMQDGSLKLRQRNRVFHCALADLAVLHLEILALRHQ